MNFFNRALKNITRKVSKSILLVLTFLLIGTLVIVGLGVSNAAKEAKILTRQKMRAVATMEVDYTAYYKYIETLEDEDEINKAYQNYPSVTLAEVNDVLKDSRVKTANATQVRMVYKNDEFDYVHLNNQMEENDSGQSCYYDDNGNQKCVDYVNPAFSVKANYFPNMIEFADGDYKIVEGSFYTQEDIDNANKKVLVSKAFAELNNVKVGDTISFFLVSPSEKGMYYGDEDIDITDEDITAELEVIGIFEHNKPITPDSQNYDYVSPYENLDNMFLMPGTTLQALTVPMEQKVFDYYAKKNPDDSYYSDPNNRPTYGDASKISLGTVTLLLNDPLEVDQFVEDYKDKLGEYKKISVDNEEFEKLSKPLDTLNLYADFIVWLVVINAIVIITLVTALTLKTREYEIGVLLSLGASKFKVIAQFFTELVLVAILGFTLSIGTGSLIANKVGQTVLEYQITSSGLNEDNEDDIYFISSVWDDNYNTEITLDDVVSNYSVSISPLIILEIYIVGIGIVFVSTIIPMMMIMRFNPKKILMNQN